MLARAQSSQLPGSWSSLLAMNVEWDLGFAVGVIVNDLGSELHILLQCLGISDGA